jgi:signal transduction histidine kinase
MANAALSDVLEGIRKGAGRMHEVVNMMLDVSRMDAETLKILPVPVLVKLLPSLAITEVAVVVTLPLILTVRVSVCVLASS